MSVRKPIQISNCVATFNDATADESPITYSLVALCDDGTLWELTNDETDPDGFWVQLPNIPQDEQTNVH